ncbi:MAG: hypothetical protein ABIP90_04740 [Vicinamibacterales bacterium]
MGRFARDTSRWTEWSFGGDGAVYRWTLTGTDTGPGGSGKAVRISGYEAWQLGADGLIAESMGRFDEADYTRQLGGD